MGFFAALLIPRLRLAMAPHSLLSEVNEKWRSSDQQSAQKSKTTFSSRRGQNYVLHTTLRAMRPKGRNPYHQHQHSRTLQLSKYLLRKKRVTTQNKMLPRQKEKARSTTTVSKTTMSLRTRAWREPYGIQQTAEN